MRHEAIIPLIGGIALGSENAFGIPPTRLFSYKSFYPNDSHLLNYYEQRNLDIPYYLIDDNFSYTHNKVDVVSTICPCAGLSQASKIVGVNNPMNDWMPRTAQFVFENMKPAVFWGENSPLFGTDFGKPVRDNLFNIGQKYGYTMSIYKTDSRLHGIPQKRDRSFYFFWKEKDRVPKLEFINRPYIPFNEYIKTATGNTLQDRIRTTAPMENIFYRYIREVIHPNSTHQSLHDELNKPTEIIRYIETKSSLSDLADWLNKEKEFDLAERYKAKDDKIKSGGNIFKRGGYLSKNYSFAVVNTIPSFMFNPNEERYITYREAMTLMGLPQNFELLKPRKNIRHIGQSIPVQTATDMAEQVKKYIDNKLPMVYNKLLIQDNKQKEIVGQNSLLKFFK